MDLPALTADLNREYDWGLTPGELEAQLAQKINELIQRDFEALVQLLYRVDVSEKKLRELLDGREGAGRPGSDADGDLRPGADGLDSGRLIARLIIERQWQKIESRRKYRRDDDADVGVDRW